MPPSFAGDTGAAPALPVAQRLTAIDSARRQWLLGDASSCGHACVPIEPWIVASWQRCLARGRQPHERVVFDTVSAAAMRRALEANHTLRAAAAPVIARTLGRAMADTGYFALLTDAQGIVIDVHGPVDHANRHAHAIARLGVDLSETAVGTTAIGAALAERVPVWLHRGEHFFDDTAVYSCAGAPVFGPDGQCLGMLDLTGVLSPERRALRHLVSVTVRRIEAALVLRQPHALTLRLGWPGQLPGDDDDGLLILDADGRIVGANRTATEMLDLRANIGASAGGWPHADEVFAVPYGDLFSAARRGRGPLEVPSWLGLRLLVLAQSGGDDTQHGPSLPLKSREAALIRHAVAQAGGNVAEAARQLGISRATVYRKLAQR
ncbi:helix-turn-helix domain-containing protein [Tepidimonas charontis]|uniref:Acetoin catabolism regulatory protein n=1 Tax=Tepidimonas charontis TaxID=2267262 RepID=A0A554XGQ7_9BURK|nr:helix-turn-helix domain-containing protein [Tepidimonas charontis]TSE35002.1 Acetoin catabolism regulatory protein [Tepidimonas charontis]